MTSPTDKKCRDDVMWTFKEELPLIAHSNCFYMVHIDGKSTIGHEKEQPSRDSQSALIFYAKRVAFNENKRAAIGVYKSRFILDDQFLVDFYMPLSIGLELLELGSPVHSSFSRHLFERFQNARHHALESTKVNVRSTL
jgi:hypothetical protein